MLDDCMKYGNDFAYTLHDLEPSDDVMYRT